MSDPQWPDLSSPFPTGGGQQQSQDPATTPYSPSPGAPSPYGPAPSQPASPFGSSNDPGQHGQYGQYGQYGQQPPAQTPNPYEQPGSQSGYPASPYEQTGGATYPSSPYGQPAAPSRPMSSYSQDDPTVQSTPFSRPAAPSQPMYPYGQPAAPSQPLAPYGQFGPSTYAPPQPPQRKRSLTWLWITLGALVVLIAAGGGGAIYVVSQLVAPAAAATQFCNDLKTQSYDAAYTLLSSSMRAQYSHDQYVQGNQALDQLEGQVTACKPQTSGSGYHYGFGATTAAVAASISRNKQSSSLTGSLRLVSEGGAWKVSAVDTSLLGVNLGALQTATAFCSAAQSKDYATATSLIDSSLKVAQTDWATWDQIGGTISKCELQGLGTGNTDSAASFEVSVSRASGGNQTGALGLALESGAWKVSSIDAGLLGPDTGPLKVGAQFCHDILTANYSDAFGLFSSGLQKAVGSKDKLAADFALPSGVYFANCAPKLSTYKVSGTSGGYDAILKLSNGSQSANVTMSLNFIEDGSAWKVDGWNFSLG